MSRPAIRPTLWKPPVLPRQARSPGRGLPPLRVIEVPGKGPEDVLVDADGSIVTGLADGRILRITPDARRMEVLADTGGRPLGIERLNDGALLVCDAKRGLLRLDGRTGALSTLLERVDGVPLGFCNNAAVARDGTIYFSDSSRRFSIDHWRADLLEHSASGRLFCLRPDGELRVLLDGLAFANGVALAPDESFVTVAETGAYRLTRYWLTGPHAGSHDRLIENLAGFPDNLALGTDGLIWITQASPRDPMLDKLLPAPPVLRRLVWTLPQSWLRPRRTVWVMAVDSTGRVVHDLRGQDPRYHMVTGVREHHGTVYLGSLEERAIALFEL